eukprot:16094379-Heterocapsa_arctica.AAC.1
MPATTPAPHPPRENPSDGEQHSSRSQLRGASRRSRPSSASSPASPRQDDPATDRPRVVLRPAPARS